jgi:hypothetical protein
MQAKQSRVWLLPVYYDKLTQRERASVRAQYVREQEGLCYHCKQELNLSPNMIKSIDWHLFPKGFLNHPVHLHHRHDTGLTLGAVHAYCNAVLWQYHGE